jgi:Rieske Fe-S protein
VAPEAGDDKPHVPSPSLWPVGFAVGVACLLVGLVVSWTAVAIGAAITLVFGLLWGRDVVSSRPDLTTAEQGAPERPAPPAPALSAQEGGAAMPPTSEEELENRFPRNKMLEATTLGLGAVIGGLVTVPVVGMAFGSPFVRQSHGNIDLGPISNFPDNQWMITHFLLNPKEGDVTRRTAYIRYNGPTDKGPSFTVISNRCAHLGCPVQAQGLAQTNQTKDVKTAGGGVTLTPVSGVAGFGCPCHGGAYDTEGNRIAGPPVRGLDRYYFSIVNGRLVLGPNFSVDYVTGTGADAQIKAYTLTGPGQHVAGPEGWLYPLQPPH